MRPILYLDMDEVLVNFESSTRIPLEEKKQYNHPRMYDYGFFLELTPVPGAIEFVEFILKEEYWDVYILTQPVTNSPSSYAEKAAWVARYLPALKGKIIMTQDKSLHYGHVLVDDNPKWETFQGKFFLFNKTDSSKEWHRLKLYLIRTRLIEQLKSLAVKTIL